MEQRSVEDSRCLQRLRKSHEKSPRAGQSQQVRGVTPTTTPLLRTCAPRIERSSGRFATVDQSLVNGFQPDMVLEAQAEAWQLTSRW